MTEEALCRARIDKEYVDSHPDLAVSLSTLDRFAMAEEIKRLRKMIQGLDDLCAVCGGPNHTGGTCWGGY